MISVGCSTNSRDKLIEATREGSDEETLTLVQLAFHNGELELKSKKYSKKKLVVTLEPIEGDSEPKDGLVSFSVEAKYK